MAELLDIIEHLTDVSLWALDETGKRLESNNFYSWSKVGESPVIEHNACHKGVNIIGATEIKDHFKFLYRAYSEDDIEQPVTSIGHEQVIKFLCQVLEYDKLRGINKTVIILDNARFHRAKEVKEFARKHSQELYLIFQLKYSPELNPQEQIWNWLKRVISKCLSYKSIGDLLSRVKAFSDYIGSNPDEVSHQVYARNFYK